MKKKKSLGQHFLQNEQICRKIAESIPAQEEDKIIEIGGGSGALTKHLHQQYKNIEVIEIDKRAVEIMRKKFGDITIHHTDILKVDWDKLLKNEKQVHVVGNLPYYLTSPILFLLLDIRKSLQSAVLMMQKEVAERIVSPPGNKTYGITSVQIQLLSQAEHLFNVPPSAFSPPPKVDSAVVKLTFNQADLKCGEAHLKRVIKTAFNQRRKKLSNALSPILGDYQPVTVDLNKRAEKITPGQYEMLTAELEKNDIL